MPGISDWSLRPSERIVTCNPQLLTGQYLLVGITRVRNEALILQDTLDYVGSFTDAIIAYDDASTDDTCEILKNHPKVALVIENTTWEGGQQARLEAETRHRGLLLGLARTYLHCEWLYCFDADERLIGGLRDFLSNVLPSECNGVRVRLFDAYLTPEDHAPIAAGQQLLNLRRFFGPERRDILMIWRNTHHVAFQGLDAREPTGVARVVTNFDCQHYGKAISVEQWEATCDYYASHFPKDTYGQKWQKRKGHAVHNHSDFALPLYEWGASLFSNAVAMEKAAIAIDKQIHCQPSGPLSILLATNYLFGWTGSETLLLTLIIGLRAAGCTLAVYARHLDKPWAARQIGPGVILVDDLDDLRSCKFHLAHVQHNSCVIDVRAAFPSLPIIFSSLGPLPFLEQPPPFECGISRYLAVSEEVKTNLLSSGIPESQIEIVRNLVSSQLFSPTKPIRQRPEKILVVSNKMDGAKKLILTAAARKIGASICFVGGPPETLTQDQLAIAINDSDIVVSLGRGAVEAMLCARLPLIFDIHGGDGLVTPNNIDILRTNNFSGRYYRHDYTIDDLVEEFRLYRQDMGRNLRAIAEIQFGFEFNLPQLLKLYGEVAATEPPLSNDQKLTYCFTSRLAQEDVQLCKHYRRATEELDGELLRIKRTVSWRITSPVRGIWNLLRKLIRLIRSS